MLRMLKQERQKRILNLIRARPIGTQEVLRAHLERAGVPATQSSVSRDLEELGVVKHHGRYALPQANGDATRGLLSLDVAGEVLIVAGVFLAELRQWRSKSMTRR
jgi:transcriptional regulator of arginine metabolism